MTSSSLKPDQNQLTLFVHPWYEALNAQENTTPCEFELTLNPNEETTGQKSTKQCSSCDQVLPLDSFNNKYDGGLGKDHRCRSCQSKQQKQLRKLLKTSPPKSAVCDCCGKDKRLQLDHCHETGLFRGWLCKSCNVGIGSLGDNLEGLTKAITYLSTNTHGN